MTTQGRISRLLVAAGLGGLAAACGAPTNDPGTEADPRHAAPGGSGSHQAQALTAASLLAASCTGCHAGPAGTATAIPGLQGLSGDDIRARLEAYATEPEGTTVMHRIARGYSTAELDAIATYLGEVGR